MKSSSYDFNVKFHCALCNSLGKDIDFNHKIHLCKKFPTPQTKVKQVAELGGCTRCWHLNHTVNQCNYKFIDRCVKCDAYHPQFLCTKGDMRSSDSSKAQSSTFNNKSPTVLESNTHATEVEVLHVHSSKYNIIIPTLTATIS